MKKNIFMLVLMLSLSGLLAGCETVKGVGRDITGTSDMVQRSFSRR